MSNIDMYRNQRKLYSFPLVSKVIKLVSNTNYIFGFPLGMNLYKMDISFEPKLTVNFLIDNRVCSSDDVVNIIGPFYADKKGEALFIKRNLIETKYVGNVPKLEAAVCISPNNLTFVINKIYAELIRFQIGDWLPPGVRLFNLIQSMLLQMKMSVVHSACISSKEGHGLMLIAKSNTGKTSTVFNLVYENNDYCFVSEDMTVIDSNAFGYSCPYTATYFNNELITRKIVKNGLISMKDKTRLILAKLLPPIPLLSVFEPRKPSSFPILNRVSFKPSVKIKKLIFLEYKKDSEAKIEAVDKPAAIKKFLALNRAELRYYRDPLIVALSFLREDFDVGKLLSIEERVLSSLVNNTECYVIRANSPHEFSKAIKTVDV